MNRTEKRIVAIIAATVTVSTAAVALPVAAIMDARLDTIETKLEEVRRPAQVSPDAGVGRVMPKPETAEPEPEEIAEPEPQSLGTFKLTAYCPCPECCGE